MRSKYSYKRKTRSKGYFSRTLAYCRKEIFSLIVILLGIFFMLMVCRYFYYHLPAWMKPATYQTRMHHYFTKRSSPSTPRKHVTDKRHEDKPPPVQYEFYASLPSMKMSVPRDTSPPVVVTR